MEFNGRKVKSQTADELYFLRI